METITYNLQPETSSANFYAQLSSFTNKMIEDLRNFAGNDIEPFGIFAAKQPNHKTRSVEELYIDFVSIGIYSNVYLENAVRSYRLSTGALTYLYNTREKHPSIKTSVDKLRGILTSTLLIHSGKKTENNFSVAGFGKLISWMKATGEFNEEVKNLEIWKRYLLTLPDAKSAVILERASDFAYYFDVFGRKYLGEFTRNVNSFR